MTALADLPPPPVPSWAHPLTTLYERSPGPGPRPAPALPELARLLYGGDLIFPRQPDRPHVIANFVQTLDGVVSFAIPGHSGGGEISGFDAADRFVMGLLRSCADAVVVGSGTLHADQGHVRTTGFVYPDARELYADIRAQTSGRRADPLNVIVTGSGVVDLSEPTFHTQGLETVIVTTEEGGRQLRWEHGQRLDVTRVRVVAEKGPVPPMAVTGVLQREFAVELLLHEGGPRLLGAFVGARMVDELFLTVAPQVAGRETAHRPSLVEGVAFLPGMAPWFELESVKHAGSHLFLRLLARDVPAPAARQLHFVASR
jgi:riboflavin biosynthesis pyrimidine reductase